MVEIKRGIKFIFLFIIIILTISLVSAGLLGDFLKKLTITGKADSANVALSITVTSGSAPIILKIYNESMTDVSSGTNEGPTATYVIIKFNASDSDGIANLNNATAKINFSRTGESTRENTSCLFVAGQSSANSANYTCNITMWWFDSPGIWDISAYIADLNSNIAYNHTSKNFTVGTTDGIKANQTSLTWPSISPGATNTEANEFIGINNTGNRARSVYVNASDLIGASNANYALGASNFSAKNAAGCEGTALVNRTDTNITSITVLADGNYTLNDGTAQKNLYICLETSNANLIAQSYTTAALGSWIAKVGT